MRNYSEIRALFAQLPARTLIRVRPGMTAYKVADVTDTGANAHDVTAWVEHVGGYATVIPGVVRAGKRPSPTPIFVVPMAALPEAVRQNDAA